MTNENCDPRTTSQFAVASLAVTSQKQQTLAHGEPTNAAAAVVDADADTLNAASAALHHTGYAQLRAHRAARQNLDTFLKTSRPRSCAPCAQRQRNRQRFACRL
jgi:hypothetical protein